MRLLRLTVILCIINVNLIIYADDIQQENHSAAIVLKNILTTQLYDEVSGILSKTSLSDIYSMEEILKKIGFNAEAHKVSTLDLLTITHPFVVQLWDGEFVIVNVIDKSFNITYNNNSKSIVDAKQFKYLYTGDVLFLNNSTDRFKELKYIEPVIYVKQYTLDYGNIQEGVIIENNIKIVNIGSTPAIINSIRPTCECVTFQVSNTKLLPGKEEFVTIRFNTRGRYGKQCEGVYLQSNDSITPIIPLRIIAFVQSNNVTVSQRSMKLGTLRSTQGCTIELTLYDPADPAFQVKEAICPSPLVKCTVLAPDEKYTAYRLGITLLPGLPIGDFSTSVTIETTHHRETTLTIPLNAMVLPNIDLQPELIHFGRVKQGNATEKKLMLNLYSSDTWRIESLKVPVEYIIVEQAPQQDNRITLTLRLIEKAPVGVVKTQLVIRTDHPEFREIAIPIYGVVEEKE